MGLNSEIIRIIYTAVIEPIMMYASNTWAPATELEMIRSALSSLQRGFAIKICRAYRTVSLTSAMILAGLLPLDLRIREAEALYKAKRIIDGLSSTRKRARKGHCKH
ncbi:Retrovirus-related Pol polyprotein from type-1 retrotransposable element R1 4 [Eumeta japonica]|uniref:Retrovirus-related Pol polyprotein from type-1 retrotransposable element R1 4 n=1 Tax=Eumeta variegata TaxID=151549 RepID=A0A4C2A8V6_EUMVA|nr:Retrovirus-related Pol polyprotein from type-1 retrotransposable element R1 4 [Eumeta japonica]